MRILHARLQSHVANRHPDGPCAQFYALFERLRGSADYAFVMEPDALPVRPRWLERLVQETARRDFWVKGSMPR